ncbi:domain of Kin17 curved DNA-binding protein-domain-containing protein [Suillus cothurnatus]|nr:domain of Kin17 curved DNA-binding protein-domain-containing protein [Suillus cothurnatus]
MPRAEVGTPKYLANKMKSKGLQRLRWYCQVCEKQCRDENGFKCHAQSEAHLRQMLVVGENAGRHIADFSSQFQHDFVQLLSRRYNTKRVRVNQVYQEFIQDKNHLHMNATRWVTLTEFAKHLGAQTEKGWFIAWIDSSPKALAKQEASMKKDRATRDDEQRERTLIAEQIERAKLEKEASDEGSASPPAGEGLKRDEGAEKIVLSFSAKPAATSNATATAAPTGLKPTAMKFGRPNVFKSAAPVKSESLEGGGENDRKRPAPMSAAERLIMEEQERKRRRMDRESVA